MNKTTIPPAMAKMILGDEVLVGPGKIVFTDNLYGGVSLEDIGGDNWEMATGTMIFVPIQRFKWKERSTCGWDLSDLVTEGLNNKYWKEIK